MKLYLTVDKNGEEKAWDVIPQRETDCWYSEQGEETSLSKGTIKYLTNKELTWEDDPYAFDTSTSDIDFEIYDVEKSKKIQIICYLIMLIQFPCMLGVFCIDNILIDCCIIFFQMLLTCIMIAIDKRKNKF